VESTYHHSLQPAERARIDAEHEQIVRAVADFREELKFATVDRIVPMIPAGIDVVSRLRAHVAYEKEMLNRIAAPAGTPKRTIPKKPSGKGPLGTKRSHARKPKPSAKAAHILPYTLEAHPEL
jgi:hypothetical protein